MKKNFTFYFFLLLSISTKAQTALVIPDTLGGSNINLLLHKDSVQFFPGNISHTYAFNAFSYLGPTLLLEKGAAVSITVQNQLDDTTTVHWHGLHVPAKWDGGPYTPILANTTWNPQFTILNNAATYWYHPHTHMRTAVQAIRGAAGLIIVRDSIERNLNLPRTYGVDDFPIIVQSQQYDSLNQAMPKGMQDSTLLVNGARANYGYSVYLNAPAQVIRLRLLNASGERSFNFGFSNNLHFSQIATDGGLLDAPFDTTRIRLAPGERAEIVLDLSGLNGQNIQLMSYASEMAMGIQGGPTMPMPGGPPMDSPLNGIDFSVMQIHVINSTLNPVLSVPNALTSLQPYAESSATSFRTIRFTADSLAVMDGPFYFNDSSFSMMRIDYTIPLNAVEVWKLVNETMVAHPFHLHDEQFFILDRNENLPPNSEKGWKDVLLLPPGDSIRFITKFRDFADTAIPYMFHCHILMHEDDGMMGSFKVIDTSSTIGWRDLRPTTEVKVFPNPVQDILKIVANEKDWKELKIYNCYGSLIYNNRFNSSIPIKNICLNKGIYVLELISLNKQNRYLKFVKD